MAGKVLGLGAAGLTQVLVWIITALVALPISRLVAVVEVGPATVVVAVAYFVLGYIAYGAIFAAIGALAPGTREAQQYAGFFGFAAVIPFIATGIFLTDPASPVVSALVLFPMTAPAAGLQLLALTSADPPWVLIALSLVVLAAFALLAIAVSARIFRATLLLYGMRPGIREIARALFSRA